MEKVKYISTGATFSPCEKFRFTLWRRWKQDGPTLAFVGLNPSTADAEKDDPTIRRCVGFAQDRGYAALLMLNLWAFRSTDPEALSGVVCDLERKNLETIKEAEMIYRTVVVAWGAHWSAKSRASDIVAILREPKCLGLTKDGRPRHPLYMRADSPFIPYVHRA